MLAKENFSAWVEIEGIATEEYNVEVKDDGKLFTCWIASEEGKAFSVHIKDTACSITTWWKLKIDGVKAGSRLLEPPSQGDLQKCERSSRLGLVQVSPTEQRKLTFSRINTTDDDNYLDRLIRPGACEIILDVWTGRRTGKKRPPRFVQLPDEPIHEKSKKSGTHCIGLGTSKHAKGDAKEIEIWTNVDHIATFSFKYRPLGLLQANGIAPPPQRVPASPQPENDTASAEEEELKYQIQLMQERLVQFQKPRGGKRVKEDPDIVERRARKRVKEEPKPMFVQGEVIDLTCE